MYHSLVEEVTRFLERCILNFETIHQIKQIERSTSATHVSDPDESNSSGTSKVHSLSCMNTMEKPNRLGRKSIGGAPSIDSYKNFAEMHR